MQDPMVITRVNRTKLKALLEAYSLEQLNKVPDGYANSLFWNIAHVVVTQQILVYKLSGLPMLIDDSTVSKYRKGTKVEGDATQDDVAKIKALLFSTIEQTEKDLNKGLFKEYSEYPTSTGFVLKSLEDAIHFNNFHEGIHLGYLLSLRKHL